MKAEKIQQQREAIPTTEHRIPLKQVDISLRSRVIVWLMRRLLRPMLSWMTNGDIDRIARVQLWLAGRVCKQTFGQALDYCVVGKVPGHVIGDLTATDGPALLYIHGGAFIIPAVPETHIAVVARMCRDLGATGFVVDYRLAPASKFPCALDDCENAYRALLELGFKPERIAVAGESAGGNLVLGLIQRIRRKGLPMPACIVPISPVTEMGRIHAPPSRALKMRADPILPIAALSRVSEMYVGTHDSADPELSPLYADLKGFPPAFLLATDNEVLCDDTMLLARRFREAKIPCTCEVWPLFPHAFPLFERFFPEVREARRTIVAFMAGHIGVADVRQKDEPERRAAA